MNSPETPATARGVTLTELILLTLLLGLLATLAGSLLGRTDGGPPPEVVERELRELLRGAEAYAAVHRRWPETVAELVEAGHYEPGGEVEICRFRSLPGTRSRAPYMLIHAAHPESREVTFTAYPTWGGRLHRYPTPAPGCSGL